MKNITKTALIAIILLTAAFFIIKKCSRNTFQALPVKASGDTLTIAIEYSPIGMYIDNDSLAGLNYDIAEEIFSRTNKPVKIIPVTGFNVGKQLLYDKDVDIFIPDAAVTGELKNDFCFTHPVYIDTQVLVCSTDSTGEFNVSQLAKDTVWVSYDSPFASRLSNLAKEIGDTIYITEDKDIGSEGLLLKISEGEINKAVVNRRLANKMIKDKNLNIRIAGEISFNQFQSWMLLKENQSLCDSINEYISSFKSSSGYEDIMGKYN